MRLGAGGTHRRVSCVCACVCVGATSCLTFFYSKFISFFFAMFWFLFLRSLSNFLHLFCCKMAAHTHILYVQSFWFNDCFWVCRFDVCVLRFRISAKEKCSNCSNFVSFYFLFLFTQHRFVNSLTQWCITLSEIFERYKLRGGGNNNNRFGELIFLMFELRLRPGTK